MAESSVNGAPARSQCGLRPRVGGISPPFALVGIGKYAHLVPIVRTVAGAEARVLRARHTPRRRQPLPDDQAATERAQRALVRAYHLLSRDNPRRVAELLADALGDILRAAVNRRAMTPDEAQTIAWRLGGWKESAAGSPESAARSVEDPRSENRVVPPESPVLPPVLKPWRENRS